MMWVAILEHMPLHIICVIEANLSEPHIDHDNGPQARNNCIWVSTCVYLCIIYPAFVAPWFLRSMYTLKCFVYSGTLTCSRAWVTTALYSRSMLNWTARKTGATCVCRKDYRWRQVGECADTWYKRIQPTETGATQKPSAGFWGIKLSDKVLPEESFDLYFYCGSW